VQYAIRAVNVKGQYEQLIAADPNPNHSLVFTNFRATFAGNESELHGLALPNTN
jgi:hypothetical protein